VKLSSIIFLAMMSVSSLPLLAQANSLPNGPHIVTSGNATIKATPDMVTLLINVAVTEKNAASAKAAVDKRVKEYFDFLNNKGIASSDINAANITTQPKYEYDKAAEKSKIIGYTAERSVEVKVYKLDQLNPLLDGALAAGLNEINAVQFGVKDPKHYRDEARNRAIDNAKAQAEALATGFNVKLGKVYSINYRAPDATPYPMPRMKAMTQMVAAAASDSNQTYEQQSIDFTDQIDVVFELKR
jgi:uncharacterized protein